VADNAGPTEVYRFGVNPAGTRLVGVGNFTAVGGQTRWRAFMLTLGATVTVNPWWYPPLQNMCQAASLSDYVKDVDFSPDGAATAPGPARSADPASARSARPPAWRCRGTRPRTAAWAARTCT